MDAEYIEVELRSVKSTAIPRMRDRLRSSDDIKGTLHDLIDEFAVCLGAVEDLARIVAAMQKAQGDG